MRFCDKLPKLRKDNNLSQEQLADRLGVSRQAVSKWESGQSYPDMDKMIQICGILNCTLEDLLDDGVIGKGTVKDKESANKILGDFLKFITKIYNMFCSMIFKEKMKCLFECALIACILLVLGLIIDGIVCSLLLDLLFKIPRVGGIFYSIFDSILIAFLIVMGIIIFLHLFKVRYLDYYVTVEDANVSEKSIERPAFDTGNKGYEVKDRDREKIIIRDPKHSSLGIFNFLVKVIVFLVKISLSFVGVFAGLLFIFFVMILFGVIYNYNYGIIFVYTSIGLVGILGVIYFGLELIYNFIMNRKQHYGRLFIILMIGLVLIGGGFGFTVCEYLSFDEIKYEDKDYISSVEELDITADSRIYTYGGNVQYVIDNSIDNVRLDIRRLENVNYTLEVFGDSYYINWYQDGYSLYRDFLETAKKKRRRNYDEEDYLKVVVTCNEDNYKLLTNNNDNFE